MPVVLVVVIYNGRMAWRASLEAADLFGTPPEGLKDYVPALRYVLLDEKELDLDRPELAGNLAAALFRIETCDEPGDFPRLLQEILALASLKENMELRSSITAWLRRKLQRMHRGGILTPGLEDATMLEETIIRWEKQWRIEGTRDLLLALLRKRFGRVPARVRQSVTAIQSERELQRLAGRLFEVESLGELGLA
ncbi:MAG TPA: hypothetical protein VF173_19875 [Thermoanaerobaculia bacterium]|nr:hypothetical protein [Thermoanaerobaculia bacterium]